ncbi:MAG: P-type DNA transfer ATPase VirB11 [Alphaproteobacteria bacterium]|nr:P-type DNA transfer ATPase VirB11 [Alphaproteobacteria bacterium]
MTAEGVYLRTYLAPLSRWLDRPDVTDILVNRPGEVWIDSAAGSERIEAPDITAVMLQRLAQQIAAASSQGVSREHPLLAATLPDGARVQIVAPPATREHIALAIRKHVVPDLTLLEYEQSGAFADVRASADPGVSRIDAELAGLLDRGDIRNFFASAVRAGKNIVISGGTATGKTTFLNALVKEIPAADRLVVIEDTPEVRLTRPNSVGLVAVKSQLGESQVGVDELLRASLRMRPDRILVGEIRGAETFTFLRAINSGHPGSLTTVHADSPQGALEQIAFMTLQAGLTLTRRDVIDYARAVIDIIVQLARVNGQRKVSSVAFHRR